MKIKPQIPCTVLIFFSKSYFTTLRIQYAKIKTNFKYQITKLTGDSIKILSNFEIRTKSC